MSRRAFWIILAVGAALRLLLIWQPELWYDENFSLVLARLPFLQLLAATVGDVHPPLHYISLWPLGQLMLPGWTLRLPSALFSIIALALYPRILRSLRVPAGVQLVAFTFMALMPMQIHYAQEGRMYALLELLVLLGAVAILEGRAVLLGLATAGMLYTANYGTFYVAVLGLALILRFLSDWEYNRVMGMRARALVREHMPEHRELTDIILTVDARKRNRGWMRVGAGLALGVIAWLPWLPVMLQQAAFIDDNYWIWDLHPGAALYEITKLFWAMSLETPVGNVAGIMLAFALIILGAWYLATRRPHAWLIIAALAFGPIVIAQIVSLTFQPLLLFRPLIGVTPFLYLACAYPLGAIATLRGRLYAACFVAPVLTMALLGYYAFTPSQKTTQGTGSMRAAIQFITDRWQRGDVILHASGMGWVLMQPYTDLPQYAIPSCTAKFPGSISPPTRDAIGIPAGDIDQLPPHRRIWFTAVFSPMLPACQSEHTTGIVAGREPALVMSESKFLLSAIWLLEE